MLRTFIIISKHSFRITGFPCTCKTANVIIIPKTLSAHAVISLRITSLSCCKWSSLRVYFIKPVTRLLGKARTVLSETILRLIRIRKHTLKLKREWLQYLFSYSLQHSMDGEPTNRYPDRPNTRMPSIYYWYWKYVPPPPPPPPPCDVKCCLSVLGTNCFVTAEMRTLVLLHNWVQNWIGVRRVDELVGHLGFQLTCKRTRKHRAFTEQHETVSYYERIRLC